ncbi:MAG: ABC transporter permease [Bacilli bacterium]|nr:ABC transporter permease [Bacilli bacterium]
MLTNKKDIYTVDSKIPAEKFKLVHSDETIHDTKFETKAVGWFKDSLTRFAKNKLSVIAACILACLGLFAIIVPLVSPMSYIDSGQGVGAFRDAKFSCVLPASHLFKGTNSGFWDGTKVETVSESVYNTALYTDSNYQKYTYIDKLERSFTVIEDGMPVKKTIVSYKVRTDSYAIGVKSGEKVTQATYDELVQYERDRGISAIDDFENNINRSILKPVVDYTTYINGEFVTLLKAKFEVNGYTINDSALATIQDNLTKYYKNTDHNHVYYKILPLATTDGRPSDNSFEPYINAAGEVEEIYKRDGSGNFVFKEEKAGELSIRVDYYDYFEFKYGFEPIYLFGANESGQDIFLRLARGVRFSLLLGLGVSLVNFIIGLIWGAVSGYYGGKVDLIMERVTDIIANVPTIIVMTLCAIKIGNNSAIPTSIGVVLSFLIAFVYNGWVGVASTTRMQFYRFKGQEYVLASRTLGAKDSRLIFKHILPNAAGTLVTSCVLMIPGVIFSESSLSYLGIINLKASNIDSVGVLLQEGQALIQSFPHVLIFPVALIGLLMISFNLFGNGLRDAFNTTLRGSED